ncbi:hypothetical protein ABPG75_006506 [Micractinium tetrahymenae]
MEEVDVLRQARELLASVTLAEYLASQPPRTVVSVTAADPLSQVLRRFASTRLVAAPCFADEARTRFLGFLDLMDVVVAVVDAARHQGPATPTARCSISSSGSSGTLRHHAATVARQLAERPVSAVRATANDAQLVYQAQLGNTLLEVVREGFVHPVDDLACHRLAVFQPSGSEEEGKDVVMGGGSGVLGPMTAADGVGLQVTHIVSQSDMLRFLHKHQAQLGSTLLGSTLQQLGLQGKRVLCVPADLAVIDALAGMVDARVPAVAVIDSEESGRLVGNLSISDLRGLQPSHFEQLGEPVGDFLRDGGWREGARWQGASLLGGVAVKFGIKSPESLPHEPPLAVCRLDSTFGEVLALLAGRHLHRLFVVDGEGRPVGVVSLTDILSLLAG